MSSAESSQARIRFGVFEYDPSSGELLKSGVKIKLQGQPIEILALMLARPGTVVTHSELQRRLWPRLPSGEAAVPSTKGPIGTGNLRAYIPLR